MAGPIPPIDTKDADLRIRAARRAQNGRAIARSIRTGMMGVIGGFAGYLASYFGQPQVVRLFVSTGDYVSRFHRVVFPWFFGNGHDTRAMEGDCVTAWLGITVGAVSAASIYAVFGRR